MITSTQIKEYARSLGFDACGICKAEPVDTDNQQRFRDWLGSSYQADMVYMARNDDKRLDPTLLVEGGRSIICVALNYYPDRKQPEGYPQFAYYAYGKDYHDVVKVKLQQLFDYIRLVEPSAGGRSFVDTAPVLERYWAAKAGLGFIGKNSLLIIPKMGSFFFLGELIVNLELEYDTPLNLSCGRCTRCLDACPTKAIVQAEVVDANKCISYQTIENKGELSASVIPYLSNRFYGCDICQLVCPWNRYSRPHSTKEFDPSQAFLDLSYDKLENLTEEEYRQIFKGSAVKRAKFGGLKRNLEALKQNRE
ncbi:epoxyqueuosine reductase [Dysgonomonas sp. PFB1-18]|uniref:tRNA epoxyqueuosine(34) reductase QueG n=1 Tax=unclassified Dysgonomonas TaxID=2630389 RepID=UPI0024740AB5|nr:MULTISPECIES: tRNA epoxyqueuosine(34) reductase QueG [unclassified Dysgonomonas]MDH6308507.1 epoxyqueuosine reductase [Dysgonomonas sp. PF1-14]MDH6338008.1 epoxyqueuosine reductase [Dysgonomonas sp. PF1-16]MDH6379505.1 epoxyqueuosine reductase [Dysgonomonas sp. PFB1-18]MDH6396836.1 epoxyqueuosine reductase [Dysgonomonas sp. PF1-23]